MLLLRRLGIAIGALVIAWLAVSLVAGVMLGPSASGNYIVWVIALVVGALVYLDILRRDRRSARRTESHGRIGNVERIAAIANCVAVNAPSGHWPPRRHVVPTWAAVGLLLVVAACGAADRGAPSPSNGDPYALPSGPPHSWQTAPVRIGVGAPAVVLYLTSRPGDRIELTSAEPLGVAEGAEVTFYYSPPVLKANGDHVIGEDLQELAGASFTNPTATSGPDSTIGVVAQITAHVAGRYELTGVRLHYRLNGGPEQVGEGIDVVYAVCAADPAPPSCE